MRSVVFGCFTQLLTPSIVQCRMGILELLRGVAGVCPNGVEHCDHTNGGTGSSLAPTSGQAQVQVEVGALVTVRTSRLDKAGKAARAVGPFRFHLGNG